MRSMASAWRSSTAELYILGKDIAKPHKLWKGQLWWNIFPLNIRKTAKWVGGKSYWFPLKHNRIHRQLSLADSKDRKMWRFANFDSFCNDGEQKARWKGIGACLHLVDCKKIMVTGWCKWSLGFTILRQNIIIHNTSSWYQCSQYLHCNDESSSKLKCVSGKKE